MVDMKINEQLNRDTRDQIEITIISSLFYITSMQDLLDESDRITHYVRYQ